MSTIIAKPETIVLLDADGILYAAALKGQAMLAGEAIQILDDEEVYRNALGRVREQLRWVGPHKMAFLCLSDRRNFRFDILASYKGNRKATPRPLALDFLRAAFVDRDDYPVKLIAGLEADDVCGIAAGTFQANGYRTVIISPDKDLLTIPGDVLVPTRDGTPPKVFTVTEEYADRRHMMQTLMGDTVDNYKGCPGFGEVRAGFLVDQMVWAELTPSEMWQEIVDCFVRSGLTEEDARVQARVSRILRSSDWDATNKKPILFSFPETEMAQREAA